MKTKKKELDVDFIGSQPSKLTMEEEKSISEYIRTHKIKTKKQVSNRKVNAYKPL